MRVALDPIAYTLFGIFYTAGLGGYFLLIGNLQGGREMVVFILLFIWVGDIMAYYGGQKFGKRKLLEVVSPNKTIAGAVANVVGTLVVALLASNLFFSQIPLFHCLIVAFICGIIGQFGDLAESLIIVLYVFIACFKILYDPLLQITYRMGIFSAAAVHNA